MKPKANKPTKAVSVSVDWDAIENDYRAGVKTLRQIAEEQGITHGAINKRAKRDGWERDLSAKIKAKAAALVSKDAVSKEVSSAALVTERAVVEANAELQAGIIRAHRTDITRYRALCQTMLGQLEAESDTPELFAQIGELLAAPNDKGIDKLNEAYFKAISLPSRIDGVKKLAEALKTLIGLERQAFGLSDSPDGGKPPATAEEVADAVISKTLDFEAIRARARRAASE
ncbi:MAG: hypothetical protein NUV63_11105 [Gallionella sp.]|nr:hypothetical protein [Gallionella sp.]